MEKKVFQIFDKMCMSHYLEVYVASSKVDSCFFIKLEQTDDTISKRAQELKYDIHEMWGPKSED